MPYRTYRGSGLLGETAAPDTLEQLRRKFKFFAAPLVGALALSGSSSGGVAERSPHAQSNAPTAALAPPLESVGYSTNKLWVTEEAEAMAEAEAIAKTGANAVRIITPITLGGNGVQNDVERYCNAARAAYEHGLGLEIAIEGHFRSGKKGYIPTRAGQKNSFGTALIHLMWTLAGDKNPNGTGGCVPEKKEINLSFNEFNNKSFYETSDKGLKLARLLLSVVPRLLKEASHPRLNVQLNVNAVDLALSEPNRPLEFIDEFAREINAGLKPEQELPFTSIGLNYYLGGQDTSANLTNRLSVTRIDKAVSRIRSHFGPSIKLKLSEVGAFSDTPQHKAKLYSKPVPTTVYTLKGKEHGLFYRQIIWAAACLGISQVLIFHKSDDGNDHLRTGTAFPDKQPKPSEPIVAQAFHDGRSGNFSC